MEQLGGLSKIGAGDLDTEEGREELLKGQRDW
jgi:hypothetical protein